MHPNTKSAKENKITLWTNWNLCWGVRSIKTPGTGHRGEPECFRFKSAQEQLDYTINKWIKQTQIVTKKRLVANPSCIILYCCLFSQLVTLIKCTNQWAATEANTSICGIMCVCCCLCVWAWQRRGESTAGFLLVTPPSGLPALSALYNVKIYSCICRFLRSGACFVALWVNQGLRQWHFTCPN